MCVSLQWLWMSHLTLNPGVLLHHLLQQVPYGRIKDEVLLNVCLHLLWISHLPCNQVLELILLS